MQMGFFTPPIHPTHAKPRLADKPIRPMTTSLPIPHNPTHAGEILLGPSPAATRLSLQITRIAPHFRVALLTGEPGSGKLAVAHALHSASPVAPQPFTAISAADFTANGTSGTLYLPGLESLTPAQQDALLRALKSLHRETRVILASRSDPRGMVAAGRLSHSLFERIGTLQIRIPALRERTPDLSAIAESMLRTLGSQATFAPQALDRMITHAWPENLRELHALCLHFRQRTTPVPAEDLPVFHPAPSATTDRLEVVMQRHVLDVLESCSGNKLRAAELLGISRSTLYRMIGNQPA
jgi:DNA-binding NtrC family response regulator